MTAIVQDRRQQDPRQQDPRQQDRRQQAALADYADLHRGAAMLICGCGASLNELAAKPACITIGVNDMSRRFDPDYLVVVNPPAQFTAARLNAIAGTRAAAVFTPYADLPLRHARRVPVTLGERGGVSFKNRNVLHFTENSPYVALCLAVQMGAKRIFLLGVDFTDDHFFGATGTHQLAGRLPQMDREYARLRDACRDLGVEILNLSQISRLTAFRRGSIAAFLRETQDAPALRIVSYATTPVAGVPAILSRCINARTPHAARCVWATNRYGNGISFDGDIEWSAHPRETAAALADADVVIVHNGKVAAEHRALLTAKPVVTMAHNYIWNVDAGFVARGMPGLVVAQYQAALPEFAGWTPVPNPVPLWESAYSPAPKDDVVAIVYCPAGRHESYSPGHRLYWHGKGYETTMKVLRRLAGRHRLSCATIEDGQLTHAQVLAAKRRAHIVIDECVTGSYHRSSLEGLAAGCVVVNGVGILPTVGEMLRLCAPDAAGSPFVHATLETLEQVLEGLILAGPAALAETGQRGRAWMQAHWDFNTQWAKVWEPAIADARAVAARPPPVSSMAAPAASPPASGRRALAAGHGISVVIPFGGRRRLGLLAVTLASLRQSGLVDQVVVVELGAESVARAAAARWDADYLFIHAAGPFDKARALNAGSRLARCEQILWCDGDLIFRRDFLARAVQEFAGGGADFMLPFSRIDYLTEADSHAVKTGARAPEDCKPVSSLLPLSGNPGGMGLVRAAFLRRHGGLIEGFQGWGGEDNAWAYKASLLGRVAATKQPDQIAWHLFHPENGAAGGRPWRDNPHYQDNVRRLDHILTLRTAAAFCEHYPAAPRVPPPWPAAATIAFVTTATDTSASGWPDRLARVYGIRPDILRVTPVNAAFAIAASRADAIVAIAGDAAGLRALAAALRGRAAILVLCKNAAPDDMDFMLAPGSWIVAGTREQAALWAAQGHAVWHRPCDENAAAMPVILQPLSHLLNAPRTKPATPPPPAVWCYWEGEMSAWIAQCIETARRHVPNFRLLTWQDFVSLWDRDRDLDLSRLHVAQRADFIRAFLLMRFGGMWIDVDCIVMRDLAPLLARLDSHDIIAHRERQGHYSNAFLAARPGSPAIAQFYAAICGRLRARRSLDWTALGNEALSLSLANSRELILELRVEDVQPVCWSRPEAYFRTGNEAAHRRRLDPHAWCYMLSQQNIIRHGRSAGQDIMAPGSFFNFLIGCALGPAPPPERFAPAPADNTKPSPRRAVFSRMYRHHAAQGQESAAGPGSSLQQTAEIRARLPLLLQHLQTRVLLDAPCGDAHWINHVELGVGHYIGVDILEDIIRRNQQNQAAQGRTFLTLDLLSDPLPKADVILCRDCLGHFSNEDIAAAFRAFNRSGARYLLTTCFAAWRTNTDIATGGWRPLNLRAAPFHLPPPLHVINEKCSESGGAFADKSLSLWNVADLI